MGLLQERASKYREPQKYMEAGIYPYFREIDSHQDTEVTMSGKKVLMFGSNSYMGLTYDKRICDAAIKAIQKYGTGCAGSRFLNGTLDLHVQLEHELAEFIGKDEALVYSTGFTVNSGVVSCLTGRNDYIIGDDRDHASIVDGRRLSFSQFFHYKHNDMEDLERQLMRCQPEAVKLIVTDGLFSMEGDLAKLPQIIELKKKYNASVMVDEAHGLGVFGRQGRGTCDHFGLTDDVDLIMGTFSKSLASIGGFIASDKETINLIRHTSRTYIFSASNTPAATAAALEALHILQTEPERQENLWKITNYALEQFKEAGFELGDSESPIIPLYVRDAIKTFEVTKLAFEKGVFINPVVPPACAPQDTLVRVALMATHTKEQVDRCVSILVDSFKELGIPLKK
ncbi:MAG: aminotransferase class I/II-fold pyridoxal phosphate-dependent enzyme [Bacteroidaceae bacterium]|nr:aminotransferase class I/II-fold pyridoxal phosphate-dependent enzyme [Bacteroidaceae bacterium]